MRSRLTNLRSALEHSARLHPGDVEGHDPLYVGPGDEAEGGVWGDRRLQHRRRPKTLGDPKERRERLHVRRPQAVNV